jgi:hypothetical protein
MVCGAHLFVLPIDAQAGLEQKEAAGRNGTNFSQCRTEWGGFPQAMGSGCRSLILVDALFPLDGGRRREGKKSRKIKGERNCCGRNCCRGGGFPRAGPTLLAVLCVTGVRCN